MMIPRVGRNEIEQSLAMEPYQYDLLIRASLIAAANGKRRVASRYLERVTRSEVCSSALAFVAGKVLSECAIIDHDPVFFALRRDSDDGWVDECVSRSLAGFEQIAGFLQCEIPPTVVYMGDVHVGHNVTINDVSYLKVIGISLNDGNVAILDGMIAHEIGHALLWSKNRFLDEGWATYCEVVFNRSVDSEYRRTEIRRLVDHHYCSGWTLRNLICSSSPADLFFENVTSVQDLRTTIYQVGFLLVSFLIESRGILWLKGVYERIGQRGGSRAMAILSGELDVPLEEVERALIGMRGDCGMPDYDHIRRDLIRSRTAREASPLRTHIDSLRRATVREPDNDHHFQWLAQVLLTVRMLDPETSRGELEEGASIVEELLQRNETAPRNRFLAAIVCHARLIGSTSVTTQIQNGKEARKWLESAREADPDDPEIALALASQELNTMPMFGGRHERGLRLLEELKKDPRYAEEANVKIGRYMTYIGATKGGARE